MNNEQPPPGGGQDDPNQNPQVREHHELMAQLQAAPAAQAHVLMQQQIGRPHEVPPHALAMRLVYNANQHLQYLQRQQEEDADWQRYLQYHEELRRRQELQWQREIHEHILQMMAQAEQRRHQEQLNEVHHVNHAPVQNQPAPPQEPQQAHAEMPLEQNQQDVQDGA